MLKTVKSTGVNKPYDKTVCNMCIFIYEIFSFFLDWLTCSDAPPHESRDRLGCGWGGAHIKLRVTKLFAKIKKMCV